MCNFSGGRGDRWARPSAQVTADRKKDKIVCRRSLARLNASIIKQKCTTRKSLRTKSTGTYMPRSCIPSCAPSITFCIRRGLSHPWHGLPTGYPQPYPHREILAGLPLRHGFLLVLFSLSTALPREPNSRAKIESGPKCVPKLRDSLTSGLSVSE